MGFGSRNQVIAEARLEALAVAGVDLRIDEIAEVVADQRHDAVVSGDERAALRLVAVVPFGPLAAQQHALPDPGAGSMPSATRLRMVAVFAGHGSVARGRRRRAVAVGDVENRVPERARRGDELARTGHGFRLARAAPIRPRSSRCRWRDRAAGAPGTRCCRARSRRDRAPPPWAGEQALRPATLGLLERGAAWRGRRDSLCRPAGRPVRRWRGIPARACIHSVALSFRARSGRRRPRQRRRMQ